MEQLKLYSIAICSLASLVAASSRVSGSGHINVNRITDGALLNQYPYELALFGPGLSEDEPFKGVIHNAQPKDGCRKIVPPPFKYSIPADYGWIALIQRSKESLHNRTCTFVEKVMNAQLSGYAAVIVYDFESDRPLSQMNSDNATASQMIQIPSVFVSYSSGGDLEQHSYPDVDLYVTGITFVPDKAEFSAYKILLPLAFSVVGILLITCIVIIVRWCREIRKRRRSRVSKSQLKKIPINKYKPGDQYETCNICLEDYVEGEKLRLLPCQHTFHQTCIDPWLLKNKRTCPICKRRVIPRPPGRTRRSSDSSSDSEGESERAPLLPPPASREDNSSGSRMPAPSTSSYGSVSTGRNVRQHRTSVTVETTPSDIGINSPSTSAAADIMIPSQQLAESPYDNSLHNYRSHMRGLQRQSYPGDHVSVHSLHTIPDQHHYDSDTEEVEGAVGGAVGGAMSDQTEVIMEEANPFESDTSVLLSEANGSGKGNVIV